MTQLRSAVTTGILGQVFMALSAIATSVVLARTLGAYDRGVVAGVLAPVLLASLIAPIGLTEALTYFLARRVGLAWKVLRFPVLGLGAAALAATVISASLANLAAGGNHRVALLIALASLAIVPTVALAALRAVAAGEHLWTPILWDRVSGATVRLVCVTLLALSGHLGVQSAVAASLLCPLAGAFAYVGSFKTVRESGRTATEPVSAKRWLGFAASAWVGSLAGILLLRLDQVVFLTLSTPGQLGLYVVAVSVAEVVLIGNSAIRDAILPIQSRKADDDQLFATTRIANVATAAVGVGVAGASVLLVPIAFGEEFRGAVPVVVIMVLGLVIGNAGSVAGAGLVSRGRPWLRTASIVAGLAVNVTFLSLLLPPLGAVGAAVATLCGSVVSGWANLVMFRLCFGARIREFLVPKAGELRSLVRDLRRPTSNLLR